MTETRKLKVFLCHASQDKPVVRELYQRLNAENWIDPWLDEEKLLPGQDWDLEIEKAVEASDAVIVCLSSNSITKNGYIQKELRKILDEADRKPEGNVFLIPIRFDDCAIPRRLQSLHYVDYFPLEWREGSLQKLLKALRPPFDQYNESLKKIEQQYTEYIKQMEQELRIANQVLEQQIKRIEILSDEVLKFLDDKDEK